LVTTWYLHSGGTCSFRLTPCRLCGMMYSKRAYSV
jgi:hypothetical protein